MNGRVQKRELSLPGLATFRRKASEFLLFLLVTSVCVLFYLDLRLVCWSCVHSQYTRALPVIVQKGSNPDISNGAAFTTFPVEARHH